MWKHTKSKERNTTCPFPGILKPRAAARGRELLLCGRGRRNSHPILYSFSPEPPAPFLCPFHLPDSGLPSFSHCSPLILHCLLNFKQFPSNSCFSGEKEQWTCCRHGNGQGLALAAGEGCPQDRVDSCPQDRVDGCPQNRVDGCPQDRVQHIITAPAWGYDLRQHST